MKKYYDKVIVTGVKRNRSQDLNSWSGPSARELRTQITMRGIAPKGDYAFKTMQQLLKLVEDWIKEGKW